MTPIQFVSELSALRFSNAFNPYADQCAVYDLPDAAMQRATLLTQMLDAAVRAEVDGLWVGRDLGFRGGRRTGMALTDDVHFHDHLARWGIVHTRPTIGQPVPERTAASVWEMLEQISLPTFLWNVFPLHPHNPDNPFTNRMHNALERKAGIEMLDYLVKILRPKHLVAVGNDAEKALYSIAGCATVVKVRHPSYGGQSEFSRQIRELYGVKKRTML